MLRDNYKDSQHSDSIIPLLPLILLLQLQMEREKEKLLNYERKVLGEGG